MKKVTMNLPEVKDYRLTEGLNQLKTDVYKRQWIQRSTQDTASHPNTIP